MLRLSKHAEPHKTLDRILDRLSVVELTHLAFDWEGFWARDDQRFPTGSWHSRGSMQGRRAGKTRAVAEWLQLEVQRQPGSRILLLAQNAEKAVQVQVTGPAGLIATSPPWNRARWEPSTNTLHWENGAYARVIPISDPNNMRGDSWTHVWCTEIGYWESNYRDHAWREAHSALDASPRKLVWDCSPAESNPLQARLLARAEADPQRHIVIRGGSHVNQWNLAPDYLSSQKQDLGEGTRLYRQEILGEYFNNVDGALFQRAWIEDARRSPPDRYVRRIIAVDPAIGERETSDKTGIVELGMDADGQIYVIADHTTRAHPNVIVRKLLQLYQDGQCDCIVVEMNRGRAWITANLETIAETQGLEVEIVEDAWRPRRVAGVIHVRPVTAKNSKAERAAQITNLYERLRVSHVAKLPELEELLWGWVPPQRETRAGGRRSPDAMDALVMGVVELAGLSRAAVPDYRAGFTAISGVAERVARPAPATPGKPLPDLRRPRGRGGMAL